MAGSNGHGERVRGHDGPPGGPATALVDADGARVKLSPAVGLRLHELALRLVDVEDSATLLGEVVEAAVELTGAAAGEVHVAQPVDGRSLLRRLSTKLTPGQAEVELPLHWGPLSTAIRKKRRGIWRAGSEPEAPGENALREAGVVFAQATPLISRRGQLLGVLATLHRDTPDDQQQVFSVLDLLARQAGSWMERLQVEQRLRRSAGRLHSVTRATLAVSAAATLEEKLETVCEHARSVVVAQHSAIAVALDGDWSRSRSAVSLAHGEEQWRDHYRQAPDSGPPGEVCQANRPVRLTASEVQASPHWSPAPAGRKQAPVPCAWMAVPLIGRDGNNVGLLQVARSEGASFSSEEQSLLVQLSQFAATAVAAAQDQSELQHSQARYRNIVSHTITGVMQADAEGRMTFANERWCAMLGYTETELIGTPISAITAPESLRETSAALARLKAGATAFVIEKRYRRKDGSEFWATSSVHAQHDDSGHYSGLSAVVLDISERKHAENRDHFVLRLDSALRLLTDPASMLAAGCTLLREHVGADRVIYFEVQEDQNHCEVVGDYLRGTLAGARGPGRLDSFGPALQATLRAGDAMVIDDVYTDTRIATHAAAFLDLGAHAHLSIPMHRSGRLAAVLAVHQWSPREWQPDEIELCRLVAHRCWETIEHVRTSRALVEREGRYRALVESVDQGYCVIELILDDAGNPADYCFIETNRAFAEQTGLRDAAGRTMLEIVPDHGQWWIDTYGDIALGGQGSVRFEAPIPAMGRWFEVYACQIDDPALRHVAVLFTDITVRKRQEIGLAVLADINADLATLNDRKQIMAAVGERISRHLNLSRMSFAEIDESCDMATITYRTDGLPAGGDRRHRMSEFVDANLLAALREGEVVVVDDVLTDPRTASHAEVLARRGIRSHVAVPYFSDGRWKFILSAQRSQAGAWRDDEIQLLREVAARTHLRLERADAEAALRRSEERFAAIFEQAAGGIAYTDLEGHISLVNERYCKIVGRSREELLGTRMQDFTHPDDVPAHLVAFHRMLETGRPFTIDKRYLRPNGSIVWVANDVSVIRDPQGQVVAAMAVVQDVSQRKRSEDRDRMLVALDDATLSLADPDRIALAGVRVLGEHLKLDRAAYIEIDGDNDGNDDGGWETVVGDYSPGLPSVVGRYRIKDFGDALHRSMRSGRPFWEDDVEQAGRSAEETARYAEMQIRAYLAVPLCKAGKLVAIVGCYQAAPRIWSNDDIERARQVANRCWESIERARVTRRLSENEERLRVALETGRLGAWQLELADREFSCNALCKSHFGLHAESFVDFQRLIEEIIHPDDQSRLRRTVRVAVGRHMHYDLEFRSIWPDGSIHWLIARGRATYDGSGRPVQIGGVTLDITERKQVEEALRISREHASQALTIAKLGTWSWHPESGAVEADTRCREICGLAPAGPLEIEDAFSRIHPEDRAKVRLGLEAALQSRGDGSYSEEFCWQHADGAERWAVLRGQVLFDGDGPQAGAMLMLGSVLDITDRKLTEQQLLDADRRKDEFLATLAHELRNPLAPIRNCLHILRMQEDGEFDPSRLHEMMERQVKHLVRLVDDLMEVSRVTRGKIELQRETLELSQILHNAMETSKPLIEAGQHSLELDLPGESLLLDADPVRLSQVFANLLNNAAKYSNTGGCIEVSVVRDGDQAVVSVRDRGLGIAADMLPRVFDMFAQIDQSRGYAQGGLGIGLTLVRSLVDLHGGQVEARSAGLGHGSEFVVRLPLLGAGRDVDGSAALPPARARGDLHRILVVDDNRESADSLALFLSMSGHEVRVAYDGDEALACFEGLRPDVVLMDLGMPQPDGHEVCRVIRAQPWGEQVAMVAVTGWGQAEDRRRSEESGFDAHVVKPVDPSTLMSLVDSLRRIRQQGELA